MYGLDCLLRHPWVKEVAKQTGLNELECMRRGYCVTGQIGFWLTSGDIEVDQKTLRDAIVEVDNLFPWKDVMPPLANEPHKSIYYLGDGHEVTHNEKVPEKVWWFCIVPSRQDMRKGQLYAYEVYLANIAQQLSFMNLPGVSKVNSLVETVSTQYFECIPKT